MKQPPAQRIAIYVPSLRGGGAERVMVTLANGFAARGFTVDLVLAKAEGPYLRDVSNGVRVVDLQSSRVILSLPKLVRYLRQEQPIAMLSALNHANVVAICAKKLARVPTRLVVSERSTLTAALLASAQGRARTVPLLMKLTYPKADEIVAVSRGSADALASTLGLPRNRVSVIYNPVVSDSLLRQSRRPINHPWFAPGEPPVILAAGRLTTAKNYPNLIRAFSLLLKERAVRMIILGEGELRAQLEAQVASAKLTDHVALPGFVDNPFAWMRKAALFVLSSSWEGLPATLIQAMACGTPVVSTNCPSGPAEILENGRWGKLVPVNNIEALAVAMAKTLDDEVIPDALTRAARFNVDQAVNAYLAALGLHSYEETRVKL